MSKESEIAEFIINRLKEEPFLLGAKLGALVNAHFEGIDLRNQYGGLKKFVEAYCGQELRLIPVPGSPDCRYVHLSKVAEIQDSGGAAIRATANETAWAAFTNPSTTEKVQVNLETSELQVVSKGQVVVEPWREVAKLTPENHKEIAIAFLPRIEAHDRSEFEKITHGPGFWQRWFEQTRSYQDGKYLRDWLVFRNERLLSAFSDRLLALGASETEAEVLRKKLQQSKAARAPSPLAGPGHPPSQFSTQKTTRATHTVSELREVALAVVSRMSEEELRQVWLPLGSVADVFRRSRS